MLHLFFGFLKIHPFAVSEQNIHLSRERKKKRKRKKEDGERGQSSTPRGILQGPSVGQLSALVQVGRAESLLVKPST